MKKGWKSLYGNEEITLQSFTVRVSYQINTREHSILSFFLIPESLNEIWASFDITALRWQFGK